MSSPGECRWLRACGKARGRHFEHLQLTGSVQSHPIELLGREFQVAGAEQRKARLANDVLAKGSDSRVVMAERSVRMLSRSLM